MKNHVLNFCFLFFLVCLVLELRGQEPSMPIGESYVCPGSGIILRTNDAVNQAFSEGRVTIRWEKTYSIRHKAPVPVHVVWFDHYNNRPVLEFYPSESTYIRYSVHYQSTRVVAYSPYLTVTVLPAPPDLTVEEVHKTCSNPGSGGIKLSETSRNVLLSIRNFQGIQLQDTKIPGRQKYFKNLLPGSYYIQIKYPGGECYNEYQRTIDELVDDATVSVLGISNPTCFKGAMRPGPRFQRDGKIYLLGTGTHISRATYSIGGTEDYHYSSGNGFFRLAGGSYTPRIKDNNGCVKQAPTVNLIQPTPPRIVGDVRVLHPGCTPYDWYRDHRGVGMILIAPNSDGNRVSGELGDYKWSFASNSQPLDFDFVGMADSLDVTPFVLPTTYTIWIKDRADCSVATGLTATVFHAQITATATATDACSDSDNGTIQILNASGGSGNFQYSKDRINYQYSNVLTGFARGENYTVFVKDSEGCVKTLSNIRVEQKAPILVSFTQVSHIYCQGESSGSLRASPRGGSGAYSGFLWTKTSGVPQTIVGQGTLTISGLKAGTFSLTVTDNTGCTGSATKEITEPALLTLSLLSPYVRDGGVDVSCHGGSDGNLRATAFGGTAPYKYTWKSNTDNTPLGTRQLIYGSAYIAGLSAKEYHVSVTDMVNCLAQASQTMTQPAPITFNVASTPVSCFRDEDGTITISNEAGGTGYKYFSYRHHGWPERWNIFDRCWDLDWRTVANGTRAIPSLRQGTYYIKATDEKGCTTTQSIEVKGPAALAATAEGASPRCNGNPDGKITLTASGGTKPYLYSKDNQSFSSDSIFDKLSAGTYTFYIKDKNVCSTSVTHVLSQPLALSFIASVIKQSCIGRQDGKITVTAQGGARNSLWINGYQYEFNNQQGYVTSDTLGNLTAGSYTVTVKDKNGCITPSQVITVGIKPALAATLEQPSDGIIKCHGATTGKLNLTVAGGTPNYTYRWSNGEIYKNLTSLRAGNYSVTITDRRNCTVTVSRTIAEPLPLTAEGTLSDYHDYNISCHGASDGFIALTVRGGTPRTNGEYSYSWSNGQAANRITGLRAANYSVTVTDSNSCTVAKRWTLTQPAVLTVGKKPASKTHLTCFGDRDGSLLLAAVGGAGGTCFSINGGAYRTSRDSTGLPAGSYAIRAKDSNGCISAYKTEVIAQNSEIKISFPEIRQAQGGLSNGHIVSASSGGVAPYTYLWTAEGKANSELIHARLENVPAGSYPLAVVDNAGCAKSSAALISNPEGPVFSVINITPALCSYSGDGGASIDIASAAAPYAIRWSNNESGMTNSHLPHGNNSVTVTDRNHCETAHEFSVGKPDEISLWSSSLTPPTCHLQNNAAIETEIIGGAGSYQFYWNNSLTAGTQSIAGLSAGNHSLKVIDADHCEANFTFSVPDKSEVKVQEVFVRHIPCFDGGNGSIEVAGSGGNGGFTYLWNTGSAASSLNGLPAGNYSVTATDSRGCTGSKLIALTSPSQVTATLTKTDNLCHGYSKGHIQVAAGGGVAGYLYSLNHSEVWNPASAYENLADGEYSVRVKDSRGCEGRSSVRIASPPALSAEAVNKRNPFCELSNGTAELNVSGGTAPYRYSWRNNEGRLAGTQSVVLNCGAGNYNAEETDNNSFTARSE